MATTATMTKFAQNYGYELAFLKSAPELYAVFQKAVNGNWDANRFVAAVRGTNWYKAHSESWRAARMLEYSDPKTFTRTVDSKYISLRRLAGELGLAVPEDGLKKMAYDAVYWGWSDDELRYKLAGNYVNDWNGMGLGGQVEDTLHKTAWRNGVNVSQSTILAWSKRVALGEATLEDVANDIRENYAIKIAPGFEKELRAGMDLYDLASPYMQTMAKILELNPSDIDLFDPTIRKALASSSDTDGKVGSVPLWQFEKDLREDPRWKQTNQAREAVDKAVRSLSQLFGVGV